MVQQQQIKNFRVVSSNLENIFNELVDPSSMKRAAANGHSTNNVNEKTNEPAAIVKRNKLSEFEAAQYLFKKRFLHFKRNYRLILSVLILPTLFVVIAMGFMKLRPPGEFDIDLEFSRRLYSNSTETYSIQDRNETGNEIGNSMFDGLTSYCSMENGDMYGNVCNSFNTSEKLFRWVLNTTDEYPTSRYGGVSINGSRSAVWYNNNGYHAMPVFLNELNTNYLRSLMNDSEYKITTNNHPLKLDDKELTQSSMWVDLLMALTSTWFLQRKSLSDFNKLLMLASRSFYWWPSVWSSLVHPFTLSMNASAVKNCSRNCAACRSKRIGASHSFGTMR